MAVVFEIASVAKDLQPGWHISETLNGRNVMSFSVNSYDGAYRPAARATVSLVIDSVTFFGGTIETLAEEGLGGYGVTPITTKVGAIDYNALADRKVLEITISAGSTLKQALQQVVPYLSGYSVTLDAGQVDGPTFSDALVIELGNVTGVLNKLSVITGYAWNISYTKVLSMFVPGTTAGFSITASDGQVDGDIKVAPSLVDYANKIIGLYLEGERAAYAFFGGSGNFSDTETVTVGSRTYTYQTVLTDTDGNVQIGSDLEESLLFLLEAITLTGTPGVAYAASTTINSQVTASVQTAESLRIVAIDAGVSGNSIGVSDTAANCSWYTEGGGGTTTLLFGADESLSNQVIADAGAAPADVVEKVISLSDIRDRATAQALADGYLVRSLVTPREITYKTRVAGLHPGMKQNIVEPKRSINGDCLVTAVDISHNGNVVGYEVTAVEGLTIVPSYQDTYKEWKSGKEGSTIVSTVSGGGGGGSSVSIVPLQPAPNLWVQGSGGSWYPADGSSEGSLEFLLDPAEIGSVGTVYVRLRAASGNVTARLRNLTAASTAGTSSVVATSSFTTVSFAVSIVYGVHRLELSPSVSGVAGRVSGVGYLKC